jgi:23S rRNA pseudouridine1911/1915/1917 synthase
VRDIAARDVRRQYLALAHGRLEAVRETIEAPIGRDPRVRVRMAVVASGKPARTDVEELAYAEGIAAVRCTLHTGRTHQIRVTWPIAATRSWPTRSTAGARAGMTRQALHAAHLAFRHPDERPGAGVRRPPPADFAAAWARVAPAGDERPPPWGELRSTIARFPPIGRPPPATMQHSSSSPKS